VCLYTKSIMIKVKRKTEQEFTVTIEDKSSTSEHAVMLDDSYYQHLTGGNISQEEVIKKSFEFLLERESKESILSEFNLRVIEHYFPEFEEEIKE
jgi:hypothetical protein